MNEVLKQIEEIGIVPVVVLNDAKDAEPLAAIASAIFPASILASSVSRNAIMVFL